MKNTFIIYTCLALSSCSTKLDSLNNNELKSFVTSDEAALRESKNINGQTVSYYYLPTDYLIANEVKGTSIDKNMYDSLYQLFAQYHYFEIQIEGTEELLRNTGFVEKGMIFIETNKENVYPAFSVIEPGYGILPFNKVLVAFPNNFSNDSKVYLKVNVGNSTLYKFNVAFSKIKKYPQSLIQ